MICIRFLDIVHSPEFMVGGMTLIAVMLSAHTDHMSKMWCAEERQGLATESTSDIEKGFLEREPRGQEGRKRRPVDGQPPQTCDGHQGAIQCTGCLTCLDFKVCFRLVACWPVVWCLCGCLVIVVDVTFVSWRLFPCWAMPCFCWWWFC